VIARHARRARQRVEIERRVEAIVDELAGAAQAAEEVAVDDARMTRAERDQHGAYSFA
jgi:hypothetical protein